MALAIARHQAGQLVEAQAIYRQVLARQPEHAHALHLLGLIAFQHGQHDEAIDAWERAARIEPNNPVFKASLGIALRERGRIDQAIAVFRDATALAPGDAVAHSNLAAALNEGKHFEEAMTAVRRAIQMQPELPEPYFNLANALQETGHLRESIDGYRRAIALRPEYPEAHCNLGNALRKLGEIDASMRSYQRALELNPKLPEAHDGFGSALKDAGQIEAAATAFERAVAADPRQSRLHSDLLYSIYFHPGCDAAAILEEHRRWAQRHAEPLSVGAPPHRNDRSKDRRLKIGYVSPDFRFHPVGRFLCPLLRQHDHQQIEVNAYSDVRQLDAMTEQLRGYCDCWIDTREMSDAHLAERIRGDQIDILVDLTLHMAGCRLLAFARRPAPVQVTWLGYAGTSGMSAIDYRLSDAWIDPPGEDASCAERTIRIPSYWCYEPITHAPPVTPLPAERAQRVTFASLNNFGKVSAPALAMWADVMRQTPGAHLLIHTAAGEHRQRTLETLSSAGLDPQRISFIGHVSPGDYLRQYQQIDIALDTTPYAGGTATCDALWMGVPVVTLRGRTAVGRGGVSILSTLGLPELIADSPADYVRIATTLARDRLKLAELRRSLRARMQTSPLMNAQAFTASMESAYRQMWRAWCDTSTESKGVK